MKIGFISLDHLLDWHGTTRLIDRIAAAMVARGHSIVIIAHEGKVSDKTPVSTLSYPHNLITVNLNDAHGFNEAREKIAASSIDICVASMNDYRLVYISRLFRGTGIPYILGEPEEPLTAAYEYRQPYEHYGSLAAADAIQVLLAEYIPFYPQFMQSRIVDIGIPAPPLSDVDFISRRNKKERTIVTVGRFNDTKKRFSLLLRAFALICNNFTEWKLKLVGDGPHWDYYFEITRQLGIKNRVVFTGAVADTTPHYAEADIFCLPSRVEGFPLVLSEAAAHFLPLVGYRSCVALDALIKPGMGVLIESPDTHETLADTLRSLMMLSPEEREKIGIRASDRIESSYSENIVFDKWEKLIIDTYEKVKISGETVLEKVLRMAETNKRIKLGTQWDGLTPDSLVWSEELLSSSAAEIATRGEFSSASETLIANEETEAASAAEIVRLRCEHAKLIQNYNELEKKHAALLGQFQTLAAKKPLRKR